MHYNPRIHYTYGGNLYHSRPFGSRNGYSTVKGYRPVGKPAAGRIIGKDKFGHPIYEYTDTGSNRLSTDTKARQTTTNNRLSRGSAQREADMRNANQNNSLRIASDQQAQKNNRFNNSFIGKALSKAQRAGNWLTERFGSAKTAVGNAARNAYNAISNQDEREAYERARENLKKNNSAENRKAYDEAKSAYQNHALTKAGRAINDAKNSVGLAARNTVTNARNTATRIAKEAPGNIERALKDARTSVKNAGEAVSGAARRVGETASNLHNRVGEAWDGKAGKGSAKDEAAKMRNISGKNLTNEQRKMRNDLGDTYAKKYSKSIKGQIENAPKNIGKAVKDIGEKISETASKAAKNLNTQVGKVTSEINRVKDSVSAGANYDKIQQDYQNMYVQYRQLQMRDSKAAKAMEPQMDAMRKAYLEMQRNYNGSYLGKASRDAVDFVSSVTGKKKKR